MLKHYSDTYSTVFRGLPCQGADSFQVQRQMPFSSIYAGFQLLPDDQSLKFKAQDIEPELHPLPAIGILALVAGPPRIMASFSVSAHTCLLNLLH